MESLDNPLTPVSISRIVCLYYVFHVAWLGLVFGHIRLPDDDDPGAEDWDTPFGTSLHPPTDHRPCSSPAGDHGMASRNTGIPLPKLDTQFEARIEAKILQKGYTVDVEEYYDYHGNKGLVTRMKNGQTSSWVYDFKNFESFLISGSNCVLSDMKREGFHFLNFSLGQHGGHIGGVADLFNFGSQYNETYVGGNETVRGIPVDHWTSCIEWDRYDTMFTLDYYFTKPEYMSAVGRRQIPVRAVLQGQATSSVRGAHTFNHIYDFTFYRPGTIRNPRVFEVPHGTVCRHKTLEKPRPLLPDSFTMDVEMIQPTDKVISLRKYYYDYDFKLSRYDLTPNTRSMLSWGQKYGFRPINLIHDYNTGTQYVIDSRARNCSTDKITMDTVDADPRMTDPSHVIMRHGKELFDLDKLNFSYQGKRLFRDIDCEVWAAVRLNWPEEGTNTTVEAYFKTDNWTSAVEDASKSGLVVGLWLTLHDSTDEFLSEWINNIYGYTAGDPYLETFDVGDCYTDRQKTTLSFLVQADFHELLQCGLADFQQAVRKQLARSASVHPLTISALRVENGGNGHATVRLDVLNINSGDNQQVLNRLATVFNTSASTIVVTSSADTKKSYIVEKGSMKSEQTTKASSVVTVHSLHKYSSGSMAGLGVMMLLIGLATGAGVILYHKMKKRPSDIPYRVQD